MATPSHHLSRVACCAALSAVGCQELTSIAETATVDASARDAPMMDVDAQVDVAGDAADVAGDAADVAGDAADVAGDAADVAGDAADVAGDAAGDAGDASADRTMTLRGVVENAVAVGADGERNDAFRLVYVDGAGSLRSERRDGASLARRCEQDLGVPPGARIEGAPAVAYPRSAVFVRAVDAGGAARYWTRPSSGVVDVCGWGYGAWRAMPPGPVAWVSAPEAFTQAEDPGWQRVIVAALGVDGAVYVIQRPVDAPDAWGAWARFVMNAPDERGVSRPTLIQRGIDSFTVTVITEDARGVQQFREQSCVLRSMQCRPEWVSFATATVPAASPMGWAVAAADPATVSGRTDIFYGYRVFGDATGHTRAQWFNTLRSIFIDYNDWTDLGAPSPGSGIATLVVGLRGGYGVGQGDMVMLAVDAPPSRTLRHTRCTPDSCDALSRGWSVAPDPLR